jgi:hypothetical protein
MPRFVGMSTPQPALHVVTGDLGASPPPTKLAQALARHYPSGAPKMEPLSAATLGGGVQAEGNAASESESEPSQSDDDFDEEPVLGRCHCIALCVRCVLCAVCAVCAVCVRCVCALCVRCMPRVLYVL